MAKNLVYPVYKNKFQMNTGTTAVPVWSDIAGMLSMEETCNAVIETYQEMAQQGYAMNAKTGMAPTYSTEIKRVIGDAANDAIYATKGQTSPDVEKEFKVINAAGTEEITFDATISVESFGGEATALETMSVTFYMNGAPTVTPITPPSP